MANQNALMTNIAKKGAVILQRDFKPSGQLSS